MSSLLYPSSVTRLGVDNFCDTVKNDPDSFSHFKVLRITHIKNLVSVVWHEYVQVIVRDTSNGKLHRIIVERQTDNDYVIIGMWKPWTEGETPSSGESDPWLPLPLFSLFFNTPLALSDVANHIRAVRAVHKDYNVFQANCYWFALSLYTNLYASAGGTATEKKWTWWLFRGIIPTYISWWDAVTRAPKIISAILFKRDDMLDVEMSMSVPEQKIEIKPLRFAKLQSDVDDINDVSTTDVKEDPTTDTNGVSTADTKDVSTADTKDVSTADTKDISTNDDEAIPSGDTPASRLLNFTQEIFKGQTSEAEYEEAIVNFPSINDPGSDDFKAMLSVFESGVSSDQSRTPYAEEVRTFCQEFLNDPAMKEHLESVSESCFDEVFSPLKADNIPPECEEGLAKLGPGWRLSQDDCDKLNLVQKATFSAVRKMLAQG